MGFEFAAGIESGNASCRPRTRTEPAESKRPLPMPALPPGEHEKSRSGEKSAFSVRDKRSGPWLNHKEKARRGLCHPERCG